MREDLKFISETLAEAIERRRVQTKLQRGVALRKQLETMPHSERELHYRFNWMADSAANLYNMAIDLCKKFDVDHPDDQASTLDLVDILRYALATAEVKQQELLGKR